jgi:hypothetical protein
MHRHEVLKFVRKKKLLGIKTGVCQVVAHGPTSRACYLNCQLDLSQPNESIIDFDPNNNTEYLVSLSLSRQHPTLNHSAPRRAALRRHDRWPQFLKDPRPGMMRTEPRHHLAYSLPNVHYLGANPRPFYTAVNTQSTTHPPSTGSWTSAAPLERESLITICFPIAPHTPKLHRSGHAARRAGDHQRAEYILR